MYQINYPFTTYILYPALERHGIHLYQDPTSLLWYVDSDPDSANALIQNITLDDAKQEMENHVTSISNTLRTALIKNISLVEMTSWPAKLYEAYTYTSSGTLPTNSLLQTEAQTRGVTVHDLVTRVLNNAQQFQYAEALIAGTRGKYLDQIWATTTFQELENLGIQYLTTFDLPINITY